MNKFHNKDCLNTIERNNETVQDMKIKINRDSLKKNEIRCEKKISVIQT